MRPCGWRPVEQPAAQLGAHDAGDRIVDSRHRDRPAADVGDGVGDERLPVVGNHDQVYPRIDRLRAVGLGAARNLFDAVPVRDHEAVEAEPLLEHVGQ